jgi:hypothetical protein
MKHLFFLGALILSLNKISAQIYTAKEGGTLISFFSSAPLEDIEALNKGAGIIFKTTTGDIQLRISMQNFKFKNGLMEEHFNETYLETTKYPTCIFKGKINEAIDYTKEGENKVTVSGKMELHGVTKDVTIDGTITKVGNEYKIASKFKIKVADYNIKVQAMHLKNIAEIVDVSFNSTLELFQKKTN